MRKLNLLLVLFGLITALPCQAGEEKDKEKKSQKIDYVYLDSDSIPLLRQTPTLSSNWKPRWRAPVQMEQPKKVAIDYRTICPDHPAPTQIPSLAQYGGQGKGYGRGVRMIKKIMKEKQKNLAIAKE